MQSFDFVNRANAEYIEQLFQQYQRDPKSVPENWHAFFAGFELGMARSVSGVALLEAGARPTDQPATMGVFDLVHSYRELGHFSANLDPLGMVQRPLHPLLHLANFGLSEGDLDRSVGQASFLGATDGTLRDLIEKLRLTYCGSLGVEYTGIDNKAQREWLQQHMEPIYNRPKLTDAQTKDLMFQLVAAEEFEQFLARAFIGEKRFGAEGAEAMVPLLNIIVDEGASLGTDAIVLNMAHRGRLNTLAHVLNMPYEVIISEFMKTALPIADVAGDGDVKYHIGYSNTRPIHNGKKIKLSLVPNPSHLEMINPIMQGIVRCKQDVLDDEERHRTIPLAIHGDAAFTGQGVVAETLNLSELRGFRTGGTIHFIVNNQVGFTTPPTQERFTPYPTDLAKSIQAPIFHVNGDDPEACIWAAKLAIGFRQKFKCDVMLDMWCYRRNGHNESDEPSFTQPVMYRRIGEHPSVRKLYEQRLIAEGRITQGELDQMKEEVVKRLSAGRDLAREVRPRQKVPTFKGVWKGYGRASGDWSATTKVDRAALTKVVDVYRHMPEGFTPHPKLARGVIDKRIEMVQTGKGIDWGTAEMLAWGTLLSEGYGVRLTGQDVERGTFSHRHAALVDYNTAKKWFPLDKLTTRRGQYMIINSMLSEFAVLGFEWGYASADPRVLCMWEAQFGDFVNCAQPIVDQIISSAESKWRFANGLVLLLPHGWEGAGPEHSNAYLERFLHMSAEDNWQVIVPSTPAQYFHALRKQMHRKFRKPLISFMPKSILRDPQRASNIEEFTDHNWQNLIDDPGAPNDRDSVKRLLFCSGKVYYPLRDARQMHGRSDVAIVRVEQLYPFPQKEIQAILSKYRRAEEIGWVQEEPRNRGAWTYMQGRLLSMLGDNQILAYHGRDEAASPAVGSLIVHKAEEEELIAHALELPLDKKEKHHVAKPSNGEPTAAPATTTSTPEPQPVAK